MDIAIRDVVGVAVLDLAGKFTRGDGEEVLREHVDRLLVEGRRQFLLNLEKVPYMDSKGIGELVLVHKRTVASGGTVKLLNPLKRVYDVLQLVKLDTVFETYLEEAAAIASFQGCG
jgi:anti-sigma B factor antagonist